MPVVELEVNEEEGGERKGGECSGGGERGMKGTEEREEAAGREESL